MECSWEEYLDITLLITSYFMNTWLVPNSVVLCLYNSLVMEEAAQVLEIGTLIPMLLQNAEVTHSSNGEESTTGCRLKRIVLIGDQSFDL